MEKPRLFGKVADGIWIGNSTLASDEFFFQVNDISAIIKLDRNIISGVDVDEFIFAVPDDELMEMEYQKTITKLESICETIKELRDNRRNILIQCADGKNKSALVAGYYITRRGGVDADRAISFLTTIYFSADQVKEEQKDRERFLKIQNMDPVQELTGEDLKKQEERRKLRALTNVSFQKIIRLKK